MSVPALHCGSAAAPAHWTTRPASARRSVPRAVGIALAAAALLAGCGGGISVGFGFGSDGDDRPNVSLIASAESASAGQTLRLSAAASDDFAIDVVQFLRVERDGSVTLLANDLTEPYQIDTVVPAASAGEVRYFARAFDDAGQRSDSADVVVRVMP